MRRKIALSALLAGLLAVTVAAVTLAGDRRSDNRRADDQRPVAAKQLRGHGHGHGGGMHAVVLASLADRLGVSPEALRDAMRATKRRTLQRAVDRGVITATQRDALVTCLEQRARRDRTCNRRLARRAFRAIRREAQPATFAERKRELAADLAAELGLPEDEVIAAVRAELVERLGQAVTFGVVSERGRELALGCFDDPASCDLKALRAEVRLGHFGGRHGKRR